MQGWSTPVYCYYKSEGETSNRRSNPVVPKVGGEAEMGGWGLIGDPVNNYISVVLLT